jgi:uncharacterized protein
MPDLARLIEALSRPEIYPEPTTRVDFIQTQMSCVFLTDNYAYKIKKPVNLGYVDYTSLERRKYYCERELVLNRRLCPTGYLGVVALTEEAGRLSISGTGEAVEYAVKMLRLPPTHMLDFLLNNDGVTADMMSQVASKVADFHRMAETNDTIAEFGSVEAVIRNTEENFSQTEKYAGRVISPGQLSKIRNYTRDFITRQPALFEKRMSEGHIRDCHGDLHAAHICFCQDLCIYDCIEFNDRFRYGDTAAEVAFLAMDLDHYGRADLSLDLVRAYVTESQDHDLTRLLNFYKCYRAYVRGKVACFKLDDPYISPADRQAAQSTAQAYFDLATSYTRQRPLMIITIGFTGTGKSTLAGELSRRLGLAYFSSDITRKRLAGVPLTQRNCDAPASGLYSPELTRRTYDALFDHAKETLFQDGSTILDAAFLKGANDSMRLKWPRRQELISICWIAASARN